MLLNASRQSCVLQVSTFLRRENFNTCTYITSVYAIFSCVILGCGPLTFQGIYRGSSKKSEKICVARWDYARAFLPCIQPE